MAATKQQFLRGYVDDIDIVLVHNQAFAYTHEDIILQLLKHFIKEVQLEGHLVRLAIEQIEIRIVSICLNEYDVLCLNPYKFR